MKIYTLLLASILFLMGCNNSSNEERDIFVLGDDFYGISEHSKKSKDTPDMDMLLRVKLPPNPSRGEIVNYINVIYTLSRNQRTYLDSDPQVSMLAKIGRENIDLLLQASKPGVQWVSYGIGAINILANDKDKELILKNLRHNYGLAKVVYAKDWCKDGAPILNNMLSAGTSYVPSEVIKCIAELKDPKYYPSLINFMVNGMNSHSTYSVIKNLPDINLSEALMESWENSRTNNYQIGYLTKDTLATGYLPAFHFLFDTIDDNYGVPSSIYNAEALIKRFSYQLGTKQELKDWHKKHREYIKFDPTLKKFVTDNS